MQSNTTKGNPMTKQDLKGAKPATIRALRAYGSVCCFLAYQQHVKWGEGASTIAATCNMPRTLTTNQVDAAINAWRDVVSLGAAVIKRTQEYLAAEGAQSAEITLPSGQPVTVFRAGMVVPKDAGWMPGWTVR